MSESTLLYIVILIAIARLVGVGRDAGLAADAAAEHKANDEPEHAERQQAHE